jgi:hypothetical protein
VRYLNSVVAREMRKKEIDIAPIYLLLPSAPLCLPLLSVGGSLCVTFGIGFTDPRLFIYGSAHFG